jgi:hypothetical protein
VLNPQTFDEAARPIENGTSNATPTPTLDVVSPVGTGLAAGSPQTVSPPAPDPQTMEEADRLLTFDLANPAFDMGRFFLSIGICSLAAAGGSLSVAASLAMMPGKGAAEIVKIVFGK